MNMSDQRVRRRRSSNGKSNSVASVMAVSSIETLSTQSKVSPIGRESRIRPARSRISGSMLWMLAGETAGLTALRWAAGLGGAMAMNIGVWKSSSGSWIVIDPSDENSWWLESIATMSLYLTIDQ